MNIVILAAAERGIRSIKSLLAAVSEDDNITIFTFPEAPWEPQFVSEIQKIAKKFDAKCHVTTKVHDDKFDMVWSKGVDIIFVIGWRYLIPDTVYNQARVGCFVFHDSLLPKYRGFGPTVWALRNGESYTGASLFKISKNIDDGPILEQRKIDMGQSDYVADVMEKVTVCYEDMIVNNYKRLSTGDYKLTKQVHENATYTCKNIPEDFEINWNESAMVIFNLIRSYSAPYPGAYSFFESSKLTILKANVVDIPNYVGSVSGRILKFDELGRATILCGSGAIKIEKIYYQNKETSDIKSIIKSIGATLG